MANPRILLSFSSTSDHDIEETAGAVSAGLSVQTTIYPQPPLSLAVLQGKLTAFTDAIAAQAQGGTAATAAKNAARTELIGTLRLLALYFQQVVEGAGGHALLERGKRKDCGKMEGRREKAALRDPPTFIFPSYPIF